MKTADHGSSTIITRSLQCTFLVCTTPCTIATIDDSNVCFTSELRGLLIRGGDVLEAISRVDTVVFDKTGTLTLGRPTLQQLQPCTTTGDRARLLALAAAVERSSSHPIGKAVVAAADAEGLPALAVEDGSLLQEAGSGVRGRVDGVEVAIGTWEWAQRCAKGVGGGPPGLTRVAVANSSAVYLVVDGRLAAVMEVSDELRPDAAATVAALKARGVDPVILSGACESQGERWCWALTCETD